MILSDRDIRKYLEEGKIRIDPKPNLQRQLGSCSVDLRLGYRFRIFEHSKHPFIDLRDKQTTQKVTSEIVVKRGEPFIMHPGEFVLASTLERIELPDNILGRLEGRSSLGRLGIIVHSTASVFDPGWDGTATMELGNLGLLPVALYPGMRICAFTFQLLSSSVDVPYKMKKGNKYAGQLGPEESRISQEVEDDLRELERQLALPIN